MEKGRNCQHCSMRNGPGKPVADSCSATASEDDKYCVIGSWGSLTEPFFEDYEGAPEGAVRFMRNGEWDYATEEGGFTAEMSEACYWYLDESITV